MKTMRAIKMAEIMKSLFRTLIIAQVAFLSIFEHSNAFSIPAPFNAFTFCQVLFLIILFLNFNMFSLLL